MAHKLAVLPPRIMLSTVQRAIRMAWLQLVPFLKPNWLLDVVNND